MRVLVTGAAGFVGKYVVDRLLEAGHEVRTLLRSVEQSPDLPWHAHPRVELCYGGFSEPDECRQWLERMDTVVHLAATQANSWQQQQQRTVADTESLVDVACERRINRFILASSFAIYDYTRMPRESNIDERSPLMSDPRKCGPYPWAKLQQEEKVRRGNRESGLPFAILRLGSVYGPNATWTHRLGIMKGRTWIRFGSRAKIPLVYVGNAADAIALAVDAPAATNETLNVVDDGCPTQREYMMELRAFLKPRPRIVPISFRALRLASASMWALARSFGQQRRIPLTLRPMCLDAMAKPMYYPNDRIKHVLGWEPRVTRVDALRRIFGEIE